MIKKVETPKNINWDDTPDNLIKRHRLITDAYKKINELVDAVNGILDYAPLETAQKAEPEYKNRNVKQAEKWMYCLCRFWNDGCDSYYGELVNIDTKVSSDAPFERDTGDRYQCCEPVKPDSEIIYHGE